MQLHSYKLNVGLQFQILNEFKWYVCDAVMVANIEIRGVDSQSCHFIWGLMLGYYDVEDTWPQFNRTKQACAPHARARSLTLLYCFQKGIELSISFIVYTLTDVHSVFIQGFMA